MKMKKTKKVKVSIGSKPYNSRRKLKKVPSDGRRAKPGTKTITVLATFREEEDDHDDDEEGTLDAEGLAAFHEQ